MWGVGPKLGYGLGLFRKRFQTYIVARIYLWVGEKDDALDAGAEVDTAACVGFRF